MKKEFTPREVDLSKGLSNTFGWVEFEEAICKIIHWLITNEGYKSRHPDLQPLSGWLIPFTIDSIEGVDHERFAQLCAAGWIDNNWDVHGTFEVADELVKRLAKAQKLRLWQEDNKWYYKERKRKENKMKKEFRPKDVDLSNNLETLFKRVEYEEAICKIVKWLASQPNSSWNITFGIDSIEGVDCETFAMLCAAGWIHNEEGYHSEYISGRFILSEDVVFKIMRGQIFALTWCETDDAGNVKWYYAKERKS